MSPHMSPSVSASPMYSAPNGAEVGSRMTPIAADMAVLGPPWNTGEGFSMAQNSTPQIAA